MSDPIEQHHKAAMNSLASLLDKHFNPIQGVKSIGFVLLIAEFGKIEDGRVNYISNGERGDIIAMMKEYIARHEGRYVNGGNTAERH